MTLSHIKLIFSKLSIQTVLNIKEAGEVMALIQCPECKESVSSSASMCPTCGFAVAAYVAEQERAQAAREAAIKKKAADKRNIIFSLAAGFAFLISCGVCTCAGERGAEREREKAQAEQARAKKEQQAAEAARIAEIRADIDGYVTRLNEALENDEADNAKHILRSIEQAQPDHPRIAAAKKELEELQVSIRLAKLSENARTYAAQAAEASKKKRWIEADDLYQEALESLEGVPAERRTKEDEKFVRDTQRAQKKVAPKAQRQREKAAKEKAKAEAQQKRCGGKTTCIEVSAKTLCRDYSKNEVRADNKYRGQTLVVTGWIDKIGKDLFDNVQFNLRTQIACPFGIQAPLPDYQSGDAAKLDIGDKVTLRCEGRGMIIGSPALTDCVIVEYWH